MSAGFYCVYHCFLSIAAKFGYDSGNQTCTISLMKYFKEKKMIDLDDKYIELLEYNNIEESNEGSIIDLRENYTYGIQTSFNDEEKIKELKDTCKYLVETTKQIIYS